MTTQQTLRTIDVPLPGGCVLRVGLLTGTDDEDGGDAELVLACGYPDRAGWSRLLASGLNVPASTLPALRDALTTLEDS